jgi:hypothetical protein
MEVITSLSRAFYTTGNNRTKFDSLYIRGNNLDVSRIPSGEFISSFFQETPGWYLPSNIVVIGETENSEVDYFLLLSEFELIKTGEFIRSLSAMELEYRVEGPDGRRSRRNRILCDCPEDDLFLQLAIEAQKNDTVPPEYINARKVRRYIFRQYMNAMQPCSPCNERKRTLRQFTLAEAHRRIIGAPTTNPLLNSIRVGDIRKRKIVSVETLAELIDYLEEKADELNKAEQFTSNGQTYFWLDRRYLP